MKKGSLAMARQIAIETRVLGGSGEAGHQKPYLGEIPCLFDTLTSQRYYGDGDHTHNFGDRRDPRSHEIEQEQAAGTREQVSSFRLLVLCS